MVSSLHLDLNLEKLGIGKYKSSRDLFFFSVLGLREVHIARSNNVISHNVMFDLGLMVLVSRRDASFW